MSKQISSILLLIMMIISIVTMGGTAIEPNKIVKKAIYKSISDSSLHERESIMTKQAPINIVEAYVTPDNSYEALINLISSANESIDIMIYEFWSYNIFQAINNTVHEKNIRVRILFEGRVYSRLSYPSPGDKYNRWIMNMFYNLSEEGYNVEIRYDDASGYVHAKVVIVDNKTVFVSSENFGETAYPPDPYSIEKKPYSTASRGFCVIVWNTTIAKIFENIFLQEFNNGLTYSYSTDASEPSSNGFMSYSAPFYQLKTSDDKAIVEAVFSPEPPYNSTSAIINVINNAKHFIMLELAYINNGSTVNELLNALKNAKQRGVTVQIILEDDFSSYYNEIADNLTALGFHVVPAFSEPGSEPLFLHNKGIIVDDELVLVGSINWSDNSLTNNREAGLLIKSKKIANFYKEVFAWDWNQSSNEPFDSDGDRLSNAYEIDHGLDKLSPDTDGDGLTDYEEVMIYNTDPNDASSPGVVIVYPNNNQYIASKTINVSWEAHTTINNYYIYLNDKFLEKIDGSTTNYSLSGLSDATWYNFTLVAELSTGVNASFSVLFAIDITPPIINIVDPKNESVLLAGSVTVRWDITDFSPCSFNVYLNSTLLKSTTENKLTIDLTPGNWIISVKAVDSAGNSGESHILLHIVQKPSLEITQPEDGSYTNHSSILVKWNVSDTSLITSFKIYLNSSLVGEVDDSAFSYEVSLQYDGLYNLTVVACSDTYGNLASDEIRIVRDTVPPYISFIYPENNSELAPGSIIVKWTCNDTSPVNFTLKLDNVVKYTGKAFRVSIELEAGEHVITLIAVDAARNKATIGIHVSVKEKTFINKTLLSIVFLTILAILIIITVAIKIKI